MNTAYINRIATAVPPHDVHRSFVAFAESLLPEGVQRGLFRRMARVAAIEHRYSFIEPVGDGAGWSDSERLYVRGSFPSTARRMQMFEKFAPRLAEAALDRLGAERWRARSHYARDCDFVHRALCAGARFRHCAPPWAESWRGAHHDRLHGMLCRDQRAQVGALHCALRTFGARAGAESGALHHPHAGDGGTGADSFLPPFRGWVCCQRG